MAVSHPIANQMYNLQWLENELQYLIEADILRSRKTHENKLIYTFRHPLVRETAYQGLLKSTRIAYHRRIVYCVTTRIRGCCQNTT